MSLFVRTIGRAFAAVALTLVCVGAGAGVSPEELAARYLRQVDLRLDAPPAEVNAYAILAEQALARADVRLELPQFLVVVDRNPYVQALFVFWRAAAGDYQQIGASPVSTGRPGSFDHFETPLGVFSHSPANPDFRAEGTRNSKGIRGYGAKDMRVYDFGWQQVPKGWGNGAVSQMRLQMHATDPDLLERRVGTAQSKGCIRIPATLNRLFDRSGLLDAAYQEAARDGHRQWILADQQESVDSPGSLLVVVESSRQDRPEWSPVSYLPHRNGGRTGTGKP